MNPLKNIIIYILGPIFNCCESILFNYRSLRIHNALGGEDRWIASPNNIQGIENIEAGDHVHIGVGATIFTTRAKVKILGHFIAGPNLTIISGDHMSIVGRTMDTIIDSEKTSECDKDIIIEEDVWAGANVTILKGVRIGKGSIIAAGAVVTKDIPPYSVVAGIPARVIKQKWTDEQIAEHEKILSK